MPAAPIRMGKLRLASGVFYYLAQRLFAALRAISARFFAPIDLAREPDLQYIRPDVDNASTYHAESARGAKGNIDHAISNKGTSIVDRDDDSPIAFRVGYSNSSSKWQRAMCRREAVGVGARSAGRPATI